MIGNFLVDVLLKKNMQGLDSHIYAVGRSKEKCMRRFSNCIAPQFSFHSA